MATLQKMTVETDSFFSQHSVDGRQTLPMEMKKKRKRRAKREKEGEMEREKKKRKAKGEQGMPPPNYPI